MAFIGKNFIFDSIPSENYGIVITSEGGESSSRVSDVELTTQRIYKRPKTYLYGVTQSPVLEFQIQLNS